MNKKRKHSELYKGVFKNDKKSCLVDLKPLVGANRENREENVREGKENKDNNIIPEVKKKSLELQLKVSKNYRFGTYFQKLREDIVETFLSENDLVSFEGLFNFSQINELFNFKESVYTKQPGSDDVNLGSVGYTVNHNVSNINYDLPTAHEEVVLYEDENETILKRKKTTNKSEYRTYIPIQPVTSKHGRGIISTDNNLFK
jgi:hypothetical protein